MRYRKIKAAFGSENPRLELTSMIDVVFLLLIFFIVAVRQEDVLAHLDVARPEAVGEPLEGLVDVVIGRGGSGLAMNGRRMTLPDLDRNMGRLAGLDRNVPVSIRCESATRHQKLVEVLNLCAKHKLGNLSLHSLR
jgi:biopolymer transport protein ExbD